MHSLTASHELGKLLRLFLTAQVLAVTVWAAAAPTKPNFLFICTDDQRYDAMGVVQREQGAQARFPWFKSPQMDALAAQGVRFRNGFVTSSLCSPSRAVSLTGRYNHLNGVVNNHTPFPVTSVTYATVLRDAGYKTAYVGKWHMGKQRGPRPGFDFSASYLGHGRYDDCPFEINGVEQATKGWVDDVATDYAIQFIRTNPTKPFLLALGFKSPHGPCVPPERLKNAFVGERCRPAANENARPPYLTVGGAGESNSASVLSQPDPRLDYFRCLAGVDENLGRLLSTLDELKIAGNTMVIYTSDNGYYLGDHGLKDKRSAYEESLRVPLLVRYPPTGAKGRVRNETVLNLDVASTLLDYAGVSIPHQMQGRSWRPLLECQSVAPLAGWRDAFFYEYFFERNYAVPTLFAVRSAAAKLVQYPGHPDWTQLFDLRADAYETNDLARDVKWQQQRVQLEAEFDRQARAVDFCIPDYADKPGESGSSRGGKKAAQNRRTSTAGHSDSATSE